RYKEGILALFPYESSFTQAFKALSKDSAFSGMVAYAPTSYHSLMVAVEEEYGQSPVRWLTLIGGIIGCAAGFLMPVLMDYDWPLVVGGKTAGLDSVIPNVIFMFEFFILFGALATILGMLWFGRLANPRAQIMDPRITDDHFAFFVPHIHLDSPQVSRLKDFGASEIKVIATP
ncbi:MAG: DUF3341 domain-containing protein, partial [Proteobacteria bacterium]|nr:DUF3341 domain-containing protein [Pseudomonadota bacterium]